MHNRAYIAGVLLFLLLSACTGRGGKEEKAHIDALNSRAYRLRYVDIDSTFRLSSEALRLSGHYADGRNEARNNLAFVAYQQMDFDRVDSILHIIRNESRNQLLLLCADALQMKTCQRTGNGESFFRAKSRAENRLRRIDEEHAELTQRDLAILAYAQSELHIIASTYYFYQEQDSLAQAELARVLPCLDLHVDTAQWVYYNYMLGPGRLVQGENDRDITLQEFDYLYRAYTLSHREGMRYFEANSLQAFASMFLTHDSLIHAERPDAYNVLLTQHSSQLDAEDHDLSLSFAHHALSLFKAYNDLFQTACTYRTLGEVFFERGQYDKAMESYAQALHCVNTHHLRYYGKISPDTLTAFNPYDLERSVEKEWIENPKVKTVPDWIAGIRQQFSLTFSALGMKQASDYNRNFYLDLLEATNQNLELETRSAQLKKQTQSLYVRMRICLWLMLTALALFLLFRYRLKRQSNHSLEDIKTLYVYLKNGNLPTSMPEKESPLLATYQRLSAWTNERTTDLEEQREELSEQVQMSNLRVKDNKRKNAENRAKVSLVHAIVPFLDRIGGEVVRMNQQGKIGAERREYITELVDRIEQYNAILTEWIKMEQGQLNLHISTFSLSKIFQIIAEGHFSFDQKGVELCVEPVEASVKADESLTLFMINTLADNARKFTPEGGRVTISAEEAEDYVEVRVTDTGCGLSLEDVDTLNNNKVYDAGKIGSQNGNKGFGFGLMNCRGIIEKYKKTSSLFACCAFGVRSKMGEGSTFYFRLPRVARVLIALLLMPLLVQANEVDDLYDSVFVANVEARYHDAIKSAECVLDVLNSQHSDLPALLLRDSIGLQREDADMQWAQGGAKADYNMIVGLRNEVALAALALNDWDLYHYNNRICIRLHRFIHQDKTLPTYYMKLEQTHQNSNLLMVFIILSALLILVMAYKMLVRGQVRTERQIGKLKGYLLHLANVAMTRPQESEYLQQTAMYPSMAKWAADYQQQVGEIAVRPLNVLEADIARLGDEKARLDYEQNRLYIQNQVLDNCLSSIKHESMYYPSRIRILAETMEEKDIERFTELVQYYRHLYTLLCRQADAQVSLPGFKRQNIDAVQALQRAETIARRLAQRAKAKVGISSDNQLAAGVSVLGDEILLDSLFESLLQGMMHPDADLSLCAREEGDFVVYRLCDKSVSLSDEAMGNLFYPESGHITYLVAKQILREHDTYANHPGCRLAAEGCEEGGYAIYFTLLKSKR